jgi:hypothetical protein
MKRQQQLFGLALAFMGWFAAPVDALTLRDFGPVGVNASETLRMVLKSAAPVFPGVSVPFHCHGQLYVSVNGQPASVPFDLYPGQIKTFDVDPAQLGPSNTPVNLWELSALVALGDVETDSAKARNEKHCSKNVTATVQILDRATGEIRRVDDSFTDIAAQAEIR